MIKICKFENNSRTLKKVTLKTVGKHARFLNKCILFFLFFINLIRRTEL